MKKKFRLNFTITIILCCLLPLLIGMSVLSVISYTSMKKNIRSEMESNLLTASELTNQYFGTDYTEWQKGMGLSIEGTEEEWKERPDFPESDQQFIDALLDTGVQLTVFKGNKRFLTSFRESNGQRVYGTEASAEIYADVMKGNTHIAENVPINGENFMVCYKPMRNMDSDGKIIGMAFAGISESAFDAACSKLLKTIVTILVICIVIFVVIAVVVARAIASPLSKIVNVTNDLANGVLDSDTQIDSFEHETDQLITSVKTLQTSLKTIVENIRTTSNNLSSNVAETNNLCTSSDTGAKQISGAVDELARATQSMAENVQNLATNMGEIAISIDNINGATGELKETTAVIEMVSQEAKKDILSVAESAQTSVDAVTNINEHMTELSSAISEINQATELIASISSQTSLLSLNASIEAARAGEAGKGFAVVAGEISKLAEQSDEGTKKIDDVTKTLLGLSEQSLHLTREITEVIKDEQLKVKATEDSFLKLAEQIELSLAQITAIANDIEILNRAKDNANSAVQDLSAISEENAASNEEVTASVTNLAGNISDIAGRSNGLEQMSEVLQDAIKVFK